MMKTCLLLILLITLIYAQISPRKSNNDDREYKIIELKNQLEVLLISDPNADFAAASMNVGVGSFSNPKNVLGLAHFCEHMLFLGSKKFPNENEFSGFLANHGGDSNAYTSSENTNYFFKVDSNYLYGALDRWAQFFIAPLFTKSATSREVNAVSSENSKNLNNDIWRIDQLMRNMSNPDYPYSQFSTGNNKTLIEIPLSYGLDTQQELLKFHTEYYSANLMKLAILGAESFENLEKWAIELFSSVPNTNATKPSWNSVPFRPQDLMIKIEAVPVINDKKLHLIFPFDAINSSYWNIHPDLFLSHLLGHEAEGTVLSNLRNFGWGTSLSAGIYENLAEFSVFDIEILLTDTGFDHIDDIILLVFQYIELLRTNGIEEWRYNEIKAMAEIHFEYLEKREVDVYVSDLSEAMSIYPKDHILDRDYYYSSWNSSVGEVIQHFLSQMKPKNLRVIVTAQNFEGKTDKVEEWYGTEYSVGNISTEKIELWSSPGENKNLTLPLKNVFVPLKFDLKQPDKENDIPELIVNNGTFKAWYKHDTLFKIPKANLYINIKSPIFESPENAMALSILVAMITDQSKNFSYYAALGGLDFDLSATSKGMLVCFFL